MADPSISNEELQELCAKLNALDLSDSQRVFLDTVLKIVWDYVGTHESLDAQFDGCFEPDEAESILAYRSSLGHESITRSITRASGDASITRAKNPPRPTICSNTPPPQT